MLTRSEKLLHELIDQIIAKIQQKFLPQKAQLLSEFARKYYAAVCYDDIKQHNIDDLLAILISHWNLIYERSSSDSKVRVFNPQFEKDGWQSQYTIVQISHDNQPFIVDSVRANINKHGLLIRMTIHTGGINLVRDKNHQIIKILANGEVSKETSTEAPVLLEIDRITDSEELAELANSIKQTLFDAKIVVDDWPKMRERAQQLLAMLDENLPLLQSEEITEAKDFLLWLLHDNFIFLGCRDYRLISRKGKKCLQAIPGTGIGVLRKKRLPKTSAEFSMLLPEVEKLILSPQILLFAKTNTLATVHRDTYTDYVGVKRFDKNGILIGETRFIGLYTSLAYCTNPEKIPCLRHKVGQVLQVSKLNLLGYAGKFLRTILNSLPREDLLQASVKELLDLSLNILHLHERQRVRLLMRKDVYNRYFSCLVFIPRDRFDTMICHKVQEVLMQSLSGNSITFNLTFSSSALVRIHFTVRVNPQEENNPDVDAIEKQVIRVTRFWDDDFRDELINYYGGSTGLHYVDRYQKAFPASYREKFLALTAVLDIKHIEGLSHENKLNLYFYRATEQNDKKSLHLKLFRRYHTISLSNVLPMLENMGLRVIEECPHRIEPKNQSVVWLNDFEMTYTSGQAIDVDKIRVVFQTAFAAVWNGQAENDGFNRLVLAEQMNWREVVILRAYAKYLRQIGFTFSQKYIEDSLTEHSNISRYLIDLFNTKFNPEINIKLEPSAFQASVEVIETKILKTLDEVSSLDQDRILRRYLDLIKATLRTNYFQKDQGNSYKPYMAFKFDSGQIPDMPRPHPKYEIFVYSTEFEGVHLRISKVARGGLRWSDRREDFRTEILGLMKAQQVKNAVIVPHGAKGGFFVKCTAKNANRDTVMRDGIRCYSNFIRGLLDLTDNLKDQQLVFPANTVCYDGDDSYLVVAADKGTATFSDIANEISKEYNFWLGDAFASGGSTGYDHKKIGITARGTWESVQRHFREMNIDTQTQDFTVVGIGDMAGDVFGNSMLLSRHICLVAAFNHKHIFIDPKPNPEASFLERQRLFHLPRSTWADYDLHAISKGGGIFPRTAKYIQLSPEIKELLAISKDFVVPNDLIRAILKANVDLLINGGIGTFVKASQERNVDVGDRANDAVRIDATELKCKVVAEGGNLGLTQLARIEYALKGGRIYTDFIDNSAGVDCSDHEVNIKILLNGIVSDGAITWKQRNRLLHEMTPQVANLVLADNYRQTQAISLELFEASQKIDLFALFIRELEQQGRIDRTLEYLPNDEEIANRKAAEQGLTAPELAILLAYSKISLKEEILASQLPENHMLRKLLLYEFPPYLRAKYYKQMHSHSLRREIVATQLSNRIVNEMGLTFVHQMQKESNASVVEIIKAYAISKTVFDKDKLLGEIEALDLQIETEMQMTMMQQINRLIAHSTRWFLHNRSGLLDIETVTAQFAQPVAALERNLAKIIIAANNENDVNDRVNELIAKNIPQDIASKIVNCSFLMLALDIIQAVLDTGFSVRSVAVTFFVLGASLELDWFRTQILSYQPESQWELLARVKYSDDLDYLQRKLTIAALTMPARHNKSIQSRIDNWLHQKQDLLDRWRTTITNIRAATAVEPVMFSVGLRELFDITNQM